jgi:chondroitin 4-sulfotransferase 11
MLYSSKFNLLFVHIPKTAGLSVRKRYEINPGPKLSTYKGYNYLVNSHHSRPEEIRRFHTDTWNKSRKFTVVRNPWDRFVSFFFHARKHGALRDPNVDFNFFVYHFFTDPAKVIGRKSVEGPIRFIEPCSYWLDSDIDYIVEFENIHTDLSRMDKELSIATKKLPHENRNKHRKYSSYYNASSVEIIREEYKEDISRFGYTFNE